MLPLREKPLDDIWELLLPFSWFFDKLRSIVSTLLSTSSQIDELLFSLNRFIIGDLKIIWKLDNTIFLNLEELSEVSFLIPDSLRTFTFYWIISWHQENWECRSSHEFRWRVFKLMVIILSL